MVIIMRSEKNLTANQLKIKRILMILDLIYKYLLLKLQAFFSVI